MKHPFHKPNNTKPFQQLEKHKKARIIIQHYKPRKPPSPATITKQQNTYTITPDRTKHQPTTHQAKPNHPTKKQLKHTLKKHAKNNNYTIKHTTPPYTPPKWQTQTQDKTNTNQKPP